MKTGLSEFIAEIYQGRKSGLLSIAVKGANTQLKLFFREGQIYHATCGNMKGKECLAQAIGHEFSQYFFMPDVSLNARDGNLPSLADIIQLFRAADKAVEMPARPATGDNQASRVQPGGPAAALEHLTLALIRQIGPVGAKVFSRTIEQKWHASPQPTREDLLRLVDILKDEIENPADRNEFLKETANIIS
ncbi:MAG: DUF4388 domain-containing protein [Nitrospirota bacterium]